MRLDLGDLRLFLCIVEAGSITQGAQRANLSLAAASERLRNIEADTGVMLLERLPRGVITTEAGEALAHHARVILRQQDLLKGELEEFATGTRGTLSLYANTAALTDFLPSKLATWMAEHPQLHIKLKERTSSETVHCVTAGLVEAGIISDAVDAPELQVHPIAKDHLVLIVPAAHLLSSAGNIYLANVLKEPFIGLAPGNTLQDHINAHARAVGQALDFRIQMKTFEGICEMVSNGIGLGILPKVVAARYQRRFSYRQIPLQDKWARRHLCVCFRDWQALSAPMRSLLTHLGAPEKAASNKETAP